MTIEEASLFFKYDEIGNVTETWEILKEIAYIQKAEWLYYIDDNYFGVVVNITNNTLHLCIEHFRVTGCSYNAIISDMSKLRRPINNILIDWQIEQHHLQIYKSLEKYFIIWRKLEPYILDFPKQKRDKITPPLIKEVGKIAGKWMACGYLNDCEIAKLKKIDFAKKINCWYSMKELAADDTFEDDKITQIDILRNMNIDVAMQKAEVGEILLYEWAMIKAGFYDRNELVHINTHPT